MLAVFGPPAFEDLVVIVAEADRKLKVVNVVAGFDLTQKRRMNLEILRGAIKLFGNDSIRLRSSFVASVGIQCLRGVAYRLNLVSR